VVAQVHAIGLLDIELDEDFVVSDKVAFTLSVPPMISANTDDGKMRLVLGDMIASFSDNGNEVVRAAINAQVDLEVAPGDNPEQIALQFAEDARVIVNILETTNPTTRAPTPTSRTPPRPASSSSSARCPSS
jgi:hypothetical protein